MDQYQLVKEMDEENLRKCLERYEPNDIFIRLKGSSGGTVRVKEDIKKGELNFKKDISGWDFFLKEKGLFHFSLGNPEYEKGFSLAYERFDKKGRRFIPNRFGENKENPDNPEFTEPKFSILRNVWDSHLIEIAFKDKILLEFHSWWHEPYNAYWKIKD